MSDTLRIGLPKGRMEAGVQQLLSAAGIRVAPSARNYRPQISLPLAEAKIQKPQNVIEMLAIGRLMRTGARILLLDEPTEGLAPVIVQQIEDVIAGLKATGSTIILVEQNLRFATSLADRHILIENGQVRDVIERGDIATAYSRIENYLAL